MTTHPHKLGRILLTIAIVILLTGGVGIVSIFTVGNLTSEIYLRNVEPKKIIEDINNLMNLYRLKVYQQVASIEIDEQLPRELAALSGMITQRLREREALFLNADEAGQFNRMESLWRELAESYATILALSLNFAKEEALEAISGANKVLAEERQAATARLTKLKTERIVRAYQRSQTIKLWTLSITALALVVGVTLCLFFIRQYNRTLQEQIDERTAELQTSQERYRELFREAEEGRQVLGRLSRVALSMQTSWEREDRLDAFIRGAHEVVGFDFDRGHIWLLTPDGLGLEPAKSYGEEVTIPLPTLPLSPGAGPYYQAFQTRRPVVVLQDQDLEKIPAAPFLGTHPYFRSKRFVVVPLVVGERAIGVVSVDNKRTRRPINPASIEPLTLLCQQLAVALDEASLYAEAQAREREATRLYEVTRELASSLDAERILDLITAMVIDVLSCDAAAIFKYDETRGGLTDIRGLNLDPGVKQLAFVRPGEGIGGRAFQERHPVWTRDLRAEPSARYSDAATHEVIHAKAPRAVLAVPIMSREDVFGVLLGYFFEPHDFTPKAIQLVSTLAHHAAIALENARLFGETQTQRTRLTQIFDSTSDGMVLVNRDGQIEAANQRAGELLAANPETVVGFPLADLLRVHFPSGAEYDRAVSALRPVLDDPDWGGEGTLELPSPRRSLHWVAQPTKNSAGTTVGLTLTFQDVTDLEAARVKAEAANRAKSEFLAMMSHEIRTPMNGVIGMTGLLLDTSLTPEQRQYAEAVRSSGEGLLTLINDVLDFSKIEAGMLELELVEFDLLTTVEEVAELLAERASAKGLELVCSIQPDVPTALRGDQGRLRQILLNLAGNAIKFTEHGEVLIRVTSAEETADSALIRFDVTDTGIGISPEGQARLFQSFSQVDTSTTRRHGGTGLGLAISKRLAELMDGQIGVESEPGNGSTFWFTARFETRPAPAERPPVELYGHRVLIVDDNATNRQIVEKYCAAWGMLCGSAADGTQALQMLRAAGARGEPYDLAILDLQMPEMDGVELAQAISADPPLAAVRLVMLASLRERGQAEAAEAAGVRAYLTKPVRRAQLFDCLRAALGAMAWPAAPAPLLSHPTRLEALARPLARVLVVEDNAVNQQVAVRMLERRGYRADVVANGLEAVETLARVPYDLVLMDCQMPEMDGFDATAAIRVREGGGRHTPIIAMTANAMKGDRERCLAAGMDDYISKPVLAEELDTVLRRWLLESEAAGTASERLPGDNNVVFDRGEALARADDDEVLLRTLVGLFWDGCPGLVAEIRAAVTRRESATLARAAHSLKGSASQIGAGQIARLAAELEQRGRAGSADGTEAFLLELEVQVARLRERLRAEGLRE